jgi:hypothetical protein
MDKEILKGLADNPMLFDAVKAVILKQFEFDYTYVANVSNDDLGAITRAIVDGRHRVEAAFSEIAAQKSSPTSPSKPNPAR